MKLRRAEMNDAFDVLNWRNDPIAAAMSKSGEVNRNEHLNWFPRAVSDPDRLLLIAEEDGRKVGMVRFDRVDDVWSVSINVAPDMRNRGYGSVLLQAALAEIGEAKLRAEIKNVNTASISIFERCGFRRIGSDGEFLHFVRP